MPLDGILIHKLCVELKDIINSRITKIHQLSESDIVFVLRTNKGNQNLIMSSSSENFRICLSNKPITPSSKPINQTMLLRKHFEGYIINNIYSYNCDRIVVIELSGLNELKDICKKKIVLELMGRNSNIIYLHDDLKIIDSIKKYGIFDAKKTVIPNAYYEFSSQDKINPFGLSVDEISNIFCEKSITSPKDIQNTFLGVSVLLSKMIYNSNNPPSKFFEILNSSNPSLIINNEKLDFYFYSDDLKVVKSYDSLNELIDDFFYNDAFNERIRLQTNNIKQQVNRILNRLINKKEKLQIEQLEISNNENLKLCGELLLAYQHQEKKSNKSDITLLNYYTNEEMVVEIDPSLTYVENANVYFKRYSKNKTALIHIKKQLELASNEIEYLTIVKSQLDSADLNDIEEIIEELVLEKYLVNNKKRKDKKRKANLTSFITVDGTIIYVGKNNRQNEEITHKLALPNEMWFHVKNGAGSHVLVKKTSELTESDIRHAANLAAYYSQHKNSSSVEVVYTLSKYIKKIPKMKSCFVTYSNEKTIFIDPNIEMINTLKLRK